MADDSDGEGFCADLFEDDSDGGDSCDYRCCYDEDDEGLWSCDAPCDKDDDDSNGEEICRDPCDEVVDEEEEEEVEDALCHDDDDDEGESDGSLCDEDAEGEELSDDDECEGKGGEFGDDRCDDEDEGETDGESEDFCENPSNHGEDVGPEVLCGGGEGLCVSGVCFSDDSDISDSDHSDSEVEEAGGFNHGGEGLTPSGFDRTPSPGAFRMVVGAEDSDSDTYSTDSVYEDDYEFLKRPASRQAVEGLPEMMLSEEEAACGCAVCKDVFASGQRVVFLPCKHYFHGDCIRPWLAMRSICPVCRYQLPTDNTRSGQGQAHQLRVLLPVDRQGPSQQSAGGATTGRHHRTRLKVRQENGHEQGASRCRRRCFK